MSYQPKNVNGQASMANSEPVVIASDQSAVPVSGTITANLSATDNAVLDAIAASVDTIDSVDFATQTTLAAIKAKTDNIPAQGQALAAASVPVVLTAAQITTLTPPAAITGFGTAANQTTIIGHLDGVEGLLTTIDSDTGTIATEVAGLLTDTELRATPVPVSGTVTANLSATDNAVLDDIALDTEAIKTSLAGTLTVTGGGGGVEYTEGDTDATIVGSAIMFESNTGTNTLSAVSNTTPLPISDAGGAITVDGTVAVTNAGITTIAGAVSGTEMQVDVLTMPTVTVTASNLDVQSGGADLATSTQAGAIQTSVELIDDTVYTDGTGTVTKGIAILGQDGTNPQAIKTDASGELQVDVLSMPTTAVTGTFWQATQPVSLTSTTVTGTVAVTQSGTWDEVGINDSGNSITVDYATTGSGTATGALRVELPTNGTGVIATVGAVTAITNALPAGTNAIGKLSANSGVDIGDVTLTAGTAAVGSILPPDTDVTTHTNYARKYYTNSGAVTDGIVWSPAAGKRWHVVTLYIQTSAAATVTLEDDKAGGDDPVWKGEIAANSGVTLSFTEHYPMASGEDAADLIITTSAGNCYVTCVGYEI